MASWLCLMASRVGQKKFLCYLRGWGYTYHRIQPPSPVGAACRLKRRRCYRNNTRPMKADGIFSLLSFCGNYHEPCGHTNKRRKNAPFRWLFSMDLLREETTERQFDGMEAGLASWLWRIFLQFLIREYPRSAANIPDTGLMVVQSIFLYM